MNVFVQQRSFSLKNTKFLLISLIFVYFLLPAVVSQYIFDNDFYIYSPHQAFGNLISLISWAVLSLWICICLNDRVNVIRDSRQLNKFTASKIFLVSYYGFLIYLVTLLCYGLKLRASGAGRAELLDGMDNFLLPGMSFILLNSAIFVLSSKKNFHLILLVLMFFVVDTTFNGKIFSFLAFVIVFLRLDFSSLSPQRRRKIVVGFLLFGLIALISIGVSRVFLAGEEVGFGLAQLVYTVGSEFLGVQASVGWSIGYFLDKDIMDLVTFGATLQEYYLDSVGHGIATNPAAYFIGNFGPLSVIAAFVGFFLVSMIYWLAKMRMGWIAALVLALNFQHLLRHGFDIFFVKFVVQILYCGLLSFSLPAASNLVFYARRESL